MRVASMSYQESAEVLRKRVDNEVHIILREELSSVGTCLENFDLPLPDMQSRIQKVP